MSQRPPGRRRDPAAYPQLRANAQAARAFLGRAVRHLAGEVGVRQFLDVGTGLPTADNTHEVAQGVARDARIVYVDNDPLVLAHARALLVGSPEGETRYVHADLRGPDRILTEAATVLDFRQPTRCSCSGSSVTSSTGRRGSQGLIPAHPPGSSSESHSAVRSGTRWPRQLRPPCGVGR